MDPVSLPDDDFLMRHYVVEYFFKPGKEVLYLFLLHSFTV